MFEISQKYLSAHYDAESGEITGNVALVKICLKYQRIRWWWKWHKEQPTVISLPYALLRMVSVAVHKTTY